MGRQRQIRAVDGFAVGAYEAVPDEAPRGGIVVIQEIFGVNSHIRAVTDSYAAEGYAAIAPQVFDRAQRDVELGYENADMAEGRRLAFEATDQEHTLWDLQAAIEEIGKYGNVGVVGYCYGGLLTWLSACRLRGISAASGYYGGGIASQKDLEPSCPTILHFGELDAHIPMSQVDEIKAAHTDMDVYTYPADHGFNCDHRESFHPESAATARQRTLDFFAEHLAS